MTDETIIALRKYCDTYGDKLVDLMERTNAMNLQEVPEAEALLYLEEMRKMYGESPVDYRCGF